MTAHDYEMEAEESHMPTQEYKAKLLRDAVAALTDENRTHIRRWVDELRTGNRVQTVGVLYHNRNQNGDQVDCFCCLGVAAEINIGVIPTLSRDAFTYIERDLETGYVAQTYNVLLPWRVAELMGIDSSPLVWGDGGSGSESYGPVLPADQAFELTELNDMFKWSFARIADAIEKTYLTPASGGDNKENGEKE